VNVKTIGQSLLSTGKYGYSLPFEVISILLLAAMIGSIILAKKRKD
jgi:NADH-quinone oxidoreductase subunit J